VTRWQAGCPPDGRVHHHGLDTRGGRLRLGPSTRHRRSRGHVRLDPGRVGLRVGETGSAFRVDRVRRDRRGTSTRLIRAPAQLATSMTGRPRCASAGGYADTLRGSARAEAQPGRADKVVASGRTRDPRAGPLSSSRRSWPPRTSRCAVIGTFMTTSTPPCPLFPRPASTRRPAEVARRGQYSPGNLLGHPPLDGRLAGVARLRRR